MLIENEFGEIGIDSRFMQNSGIEVTEMNSGCICCTLVGDFAKSLEAGELTSSSRTASSSSRRASASSPTLTKAVIDVSADEAGVELEQRR